MIFSTEEIEKMWAEFVTLLRSTNRQGIEQLILWLENNSDMKYAPASTYYHNSCPGGLLNHSLNVFHMAEKNVENAKLLAVPEKDIGSINRDSLIICTLLHDLCKVNFYNPIVKVWKDESLPSPQCWKKYQSYEIKDNFPLGHGEKSVIMLQNFIKLDAVEIAAIRWHMGMTDPGAYLSPYEKPAMMSAINNIPLVTILILSDYGASFLMEREVNQKLECPV
jgi:hypothetical protein